MNEKLHHPSPEHHGNTTHHEKAEQKHLKELQEKANKTQETSKDTIEHIKQSIESTAISGKEYSVGEKESKPTNHSFGVTKHLKKDAYKRVIKKTQNNLSKTEKTFSKAIHNPVIEKVSDVSAKTVARPSGILFGSIGAFVASLVIYFISKRSGFEYNYLLFVMVFVGGYFIGLIAELFYKLIKPQKS
jgi:hypothetical protein